jgi:hypothetical protein
MEVRVGDRVRSTSQAKFLGEIWADVFDSDCIVCLQNFDPPQQLPIPTFTFTISNKVEGSGTTEALTIPLRIYNRHLACIAENQINYFLISHFWDESVAVANDSRSSNDEAEILVPRCLWGTFAAVEAEYGPDIELWHDYISIPQWQRDT